MDGPWVAYCIHAGDMYRGSQDIKIKRVLGHVDAADMP